VPGVTPRYGTNERQTEAVLSGKQSNETTPGVTGKTSCITICELHVENALVVPRTLETRINVNSAGDWKHPSIARCSALLISQRCLFWAYSQNVWSPYPHPVPPEPYVSSLDTAWSAFLNTLKISWGSCVSFGVDSADPNLQCGTLDVLMDYHDSSAGTAHLAVVKWATTASPKLGTIFFNPGDSLHPSFAVCH